MSFKKISTVILAVLLVTVVGCRSNPIRNVSSAPVMASGSYTLANVRDSIITAGQGLGWGMKEMKPGVILGTLFVRTHMAKIEVKYTKKNYSITYKDSAGLDYDGVNIHSNYNGWIQNLESRINSQLSSL